MVKTQEVLASWYHGWRMALLWAERYGEPLLGLTLPTATLRIGYQILGLGLGLIDSAMCIGELSRYQKAGKLKRGTAGS